MSILEVSRIDGVFGVVLETGQTLSIRLGDEPVRDFNPGWEPAGLITAFAPLYLLSLRHVDGYEATWFLDSGMLRIGGALAHVPPGFRVHVRERALELFGAIQQQIVATARPQPLHEAADLSNLCKTTIDELRELVWPELAAGIVVVNLDSEQADEVVRPFGMLAADLRQTLAGDLPAEYRQRMSGGDLACTSPFGGSSVAAEVGLMLLDRLTAYRFTDRAVQRSFYVTTQDYHDTKSGLYLPDIGLFCTSGHAPALTTLFPILLSHVAQHQRRLLRYLATPADSKPAINFISDYPTLHIGHVIWNELSGLEELIERLEAGRLPMVCVLNSANGTELYGRIDHLFPELDGRVVRPAVTWAEAPGWVYDNRLFFIRYTTKYVRSAVGRRIRSVVAADPRLVEDRALAQRFREQGWPCILLGLRVGNRTIRDYAQFLIGAIEHLAQRLDRVAVVIDGYNSRRGLDPSTNYASFGPPGQEEPLIEELRIVFAVRRHFAGRPIEIVSTVGAPIACGLFWITESRFFVAPWGAALAKYRWICNLPGFVMTNPHNIANPGGDLLIYNSPDFMEAPAPMSFIALEDVAEAPGPERFYANFQPDPASVYRAIDQLIVEAGITSGAS